VVAAPSGAGKSSLVKALLELDSHLVVSISHTTRAPRGQEQEGREYHFIDEPTFLAMVADGRFFEHAEVHGHWYGTSKAAIEERIGGGEDVVLEIDWQGAAQVRQLLPDVIGIFILRDLLIHTIAHKVLRCELVWRDIIVCIKIILVDH